MRVWTSAEQEVADNMSKSPLKAKPLRYAGQSLDDELEKLAFDSVIPYFFASGLMFFLALKEWYQWYFQLPPKPVLISLVTGVVLVITFVKFRHAVKKAKRIKLGRDGEKAVGQYLEDLREQGAKVFHDIKGPDFNIDHVVIHSTGVYVLETMTYSKPDRGEARMRFNGDELRIMGKKPDRNPVRQVKALSQWLQELLQESIGKVFETRPVVLFPGWFIEPSAEAKKSDVWVLDPKALPAFIHNSKDRLPSEAVKLAAYHLSRYIRVS